MASFFDNMGDGQMMCITTPCGNGNPVFMNNKNTETQNIPKTNLFGVLSKFDNLSFQDAMNQNSGVLGGMSKGVNTLPKNTSNLEIINDFPDLSKKVKCNNGMYDVTNGAVAPCSGSGGGVATNQDEIVPQQSFLEKHKNHLLIAGAVVLGFLAYKKFKK